MPAENSPVNTLLPHLFRQEYARLTAVLSRYFGFQYMETAEDIASETFLKATEHWPVHGIPDHPAAWLYTVAKNKAKDYLKRNQVFESRIKAEIAGEEAVPGQELLSPQGLFNKRGIDLSSASDDCLLAYHPRGGKMESYPAIV